MGIARLTPVAEHVAEVAARIRIDARTLRRAIETGDSKKAHEIVLHLCAMADELAPAAPTVVI